MMPVDAEFFRTHGLAPGLTLAELDRVHALLLEIRAHPALPADLAPFIDDEIKKVAGAQRDGSQEGRTDG